MTDLPDLKFVDVELDDIDVAEGHIVVFVPENGKLDQLARRVNRRMRGALQRYVESDAFSKLKEGDAAVLTAPVGLAAQSVAVVRLERRTSASAARRAGASIGRRLSKGNHLVLLGGHKAVSDVTLGALLRAYSFTAHKTGDDAEKPMGDVTLMVSNSEEAKAACSDVIPLAEGVWYTRDLVNEPSNVLTTTEFAERLDSMRGLGLSVEVLDEPELEELGMRTLLAVGQGSESPSKVVVMQWNGGGDAAPVALVGKGVVFDTGGISLKPAGGMEEMTMDMGGAGTVAGVMRALALRKAKANVVGLVGLVENMPDGRAQRPGDVVRSMKGDTVEVINTDAEGRLVLCDVMWYAQERFEPAAMIDLATLTGAIIVALGHENAGVFCNDDGLAEAFLSSAAAEGEGAWRMPLGPAYDKLLKSRVADMKNIGGRWGGAVTAAQFLQRFVKDGQPWMHLDIAGVCMPKGDQPLAPAGASGWGVLSLNRWIADNHEG